MRALALTGSGAAVVDLPVPSRPDEARIRLLVAGVCATDLELIKGYMGFTGVLGHEWVGIVEAAPEPAWVGRRVVGDINCPCGACETCRAGRPTHCPSRTVLGIAGRDGAFAEQLCLPVANLHAVPDGVPDDAAVFVEPEGLALATRLVRPRGTLVMKTTVHDVGRASPTAWVVDELTLVGSRCGPFEPALRLLATGLVDVRPLITARLPLARGLDALALAARPGSVKVLLEPGERGDSSGTA